MDKSRANPAALMLLASLACLLMAAEAGPMPTDLAARRERVARLDADEQQELLRKFERFSTLPLEEQERLRALEDAISRDPRAAELHQVLKRYHEWLKTLSSSQRAQLADLSAKDRVKAIERIKREQRHAQVERTLSADDIREIGRWIDDVVARNRKELTAGISPEHRKWIDKQKDASRQRTLIFRAFGSRHGGPTWPLKPDDIELLSKKLSESTRAELAKASTPEDQRKLIGSWVYIVLRKTDPWQQGRRINPVVGEELLQFLQNDVSPEDRKRLLGMERDEMLQELRRMYFERGHHDGRFGPPGSRGEGPTGPPFKGPMRGGDRRDPPAEDASKASTPAESSPAESAPKGDRSPQD